MFNNAQIGKVAIYGSVVLSLVLGFKGAGAAEPGGEAAEFAHVIGTAAPASSSASSSISPSVSFKTTGLARPDVSKLDVTAFGVTKAEIGANNAAADHMTAGYGTLDFSKLSNGIDDLIKSSDVGMVRPRDGSQYLANQTVILADERNGSSLKYHNIATFTIKNGNQLSKDNKPTLFGEKLIDQLTGIQLAK